MNNCISINMETSRKINVRSMGIINYYKSYRRRYPHKSIEDAKRATLNWIIGIHKTIVGSAPSEEEYEGYKKYVDELE